jgi:hypothetical protein
VGRLVGCRLYNCVFIIFFLYVIKYMLLIIFYISYITPVWCFCGRFNSSGQKLSSRWFNQFLTVGPVNHRTDRFDPNNYGGDVALASDLDLQTFRVASDCVNAVQSIHGQGFGSLGRMAPSSRRSRAGRMDLQEWSSSMEEAPILISLFS